MVGPRLDRRPSSTKALVASFSSAALALVMSAPLARAALLPPYFIDSAVSIGTNDCKPKVDGQPPRCDWFNFGTGFEYGYLVKDDPDLTKRQYMMFIVTARHVVCGQPNSNDIYACAHPQDLIARFNPTSSGAGREFVIPKEEGDGPWHFHPNPSIDVAILPVAVDLRSQGLQSSFIASDIHTENTKLLSENGVTAGDGVFVVGFPMQLAGALRNYAVVRQGVIARISEMLDRVSSTFLVDAFVFPGNSGGPVFSKPEFLAINGTKSQSTPYLIGMVLAYQPYTDVAISPQTGHARVTFEENSGLAEVLPTDYIDEAIKAYVATHAQSQVPPTNPKTKQKPKRSSSEQRQ